MLHLHLKRPLSRRAGRQGRANGQGLVEFSAVFFAILIFMYIIIAAGVYFIQAWAISNVADSAGHTITTTGFLDISKLTSTATAYATSLASPADTITVEVRNANGRPLCNATHLGTDGRTCTYDGWSEALDPAACSTSGCPGPGNDGAHLRVNYGDFVRIVITHSGAALWMTSHLGIPSITSSWSGIAQRNTVTSGYGAAPSTGDLAVTALDKNGAVMSGATVVVLPGNPPCATGTPCTTGPDGVAHFGGLAIGTYTITAYKDGYQPSQLSLTVSPDYLTNGDAVLSDAAYLDVYLSGDSPVNHLTNGDFETSGGWSPGSSGTSVFAKAPSSYSVVGSPVYGGSQAGQFTTTPGDQGEGIVNAFGSVTGGDVYRGVVWAEAPVGTNLVTTLGSLTGDYNTVQTTATGNWQRISVDWTPTAGRSDAHLAVRDARTDASGSVTIGVDEALVYDTTTASSVGSLAVTTDPAATATGLGQGLYRFVLSSGSYTLTVLRSSSSCTLTPTPGSLTVSAGQTTTQALSISGC